MTTDPHLGAPAARAAGGVMHRTSKKGKPRILVVHRPKYDDWSLPKGHLDFGESYQSAALREVEEETGMKASLGPEIGSVGYRVGRGPKAVRYWLMDYENGRFRTNSEVDEARWLSPSKAETIVSYQRDARVISRAKEMLADPKSATIHLVRHAYAGTRSRWKGQDSRRPLSQRGEVQARRLTNRLLTEPVTSVRSSPYLRCHQTVRGYAALIDHVVLHETSLGEGAPPEETISFFRELHGEAAVLCTHGDVVSGVIGNLMAEGVEFDQEGTWEKGSTWYLDLKRGRVTGGRYHRIPN